MKPFWVYILRCSDGSYYIGHTDSLEKRIGQHHAGEIPDCYTFKRRPLMLAWAQDCSSRTEALTFEMQIKRWSRAKKEALIAGDWDGLKVLSRSHADLNKAEVGVGNLESDREKRGSTGSPRTGSSTGSPRTGSSTEPAPDLIQGSPRTGSEPDPLRESDERWMRHALALADRAEREDDEIPVGAVLIGADGEVLGEGWNRNLAEHDPSAHAEIVAMRRAGQKLGNHRLVGSTLYVTLEPCAMCAMAMVHARVARLVYAASDPKTGACGSVFDLVADPRHNHRVEVRGGILADEASRRLSNYFRAKRGKPLLSPKGTSSGA